MTPAAVSRTYRRKNVFSRPRDQVRIVLLFALLAIIYSFTCCYISKGAVQRAAGDILSMPLGEHAKSDIRLIYQKHESVLNMQLALFVFCTTFILLLGSIILSHRIAGAIHQVNRYLADLAEGKVQPRRIRFRKGDFFQDLAQSLNRFQESRGIIPPEAPPRREESR